MEKNNNPKENRASVYALVIETQDTTFLSVQLSTSLEQALAQAKIEFERINPAPENYGRLMGAKIGLFTIKNSTELLKERDDFEKFKMELEKTKTAPIPASPSNNTLQAKRITPKNQLMMEIIKKKDIRLYELSKDSFTPAERKYIETRLKK